jgi:hypothetical protein
VGRVVFGALPFRLKTFFLSESSISKNVWEAYPARKPRPLAVIVRFTADEPVPLGGAAAGL